jgi:uncharacterized protein YheU (UPF0270 family)
MRKTKMPGNIPTNQQASHHEEGVEVPYADISPETLRKLIEEFVSRDGADWGDTGGTMEIKIEQVLQQFKSGKVKVVFDLRSQTANIVTKG